MSTFLNNLGAALAAQGAILRHCPDGDLSRATKEDLLAIQEALVKCQSTLAGAQTIVDATLRGKRQ